ncbi:unnamed protein product [Spirodela intermedia]|uniref:Prephenate/arogenate dehydrogenase domain-containing protein n=1 Tax=Spirodela intermedia TaxID=51605 RepID=A0A7I8JJV6_SPIIN|nr:unnamed protein product [Spirodela intermedia]CAA6670419.1 unnamed protein product [Spirodela intermedia]
MQAAATAATGLGPSPLTPAGGAPPWRSHPSAALLCFPPLRSPRRRRRHLSLVQAVDAAQPFDYEAKASSLLEQSSRLKVAVVGFGNFGQFLSRTIVKQGHAVLAHSRSDYSAAARELGCAAFFSDPHDLCEAHPDVVLLCTSILSLRSVLASLPLHRLRRSTLFADVLSVKEFPRSILLQTLPPDFDIVCTHPMFGPESGGGGWAGLPFVYEEVRVGGGEERRRRCRRFLEIFAGEGCRMVQMSCKDHDRYAAETQFVTHTVGRMLAKLELESRPINTKGYETLLQLVENTCKDSFDLYNGLFMYNKNSTELLDRMELAFDSLKKELFGQLHDILRKQLFGSDDDDGDRHIQQHQQHQQRQQHQQHSSTSSTSSNSHD